MSSHTEKLTVETFISAVEDLELAKYQFLALLKKYSLSLHKNKLYPSLAELIELVNLLESLTNKKSEFKKKFPSKLVDFDFKNKKLIYKNKDYSGEKIKAVFGFINWSLPKIKEVIEEGIAIFDFIDENINIEKIGLMPLYVKEGYFIIPAHRDNSVKVYKYKMSILSQEKTSYHALKTNLVYSMLKNKFVIETPLAIKLNLIKKYPDLPNPATYGFSTDLDFPFAETILPVAKRKLMKILAT